MTLIHTQNQLVFPIAHSEYSLGEDILTSAAGRIEEAQIQALALSKVKPVIGK